MKIEVLYFDGCPNHKPAVEHVLGLLREEGIAADVSEVNIADQSMARVTGFLGSPTIRVNGLDVEPAAGSSREYGMMCRTYVVEGQRTGLPSREMIRQALREGQVAPPSPDHCCQPVHTAPPASEKWKSSTLLMAGSFGAAVMASFCCILPIVFGLTGLSIIGASALFAAWRPYLLILTFGLLGLGFYFAYWPRRERCAPGSACAMPSTRLSGPLILWLATAAVILFAAFPYYSGPVADLLLSHIPAEGTPQPAAEVVHATLVIEGMDCAACAAAVENKLKAITGVRKAAVSYEHKRAEVEYDPRLATLSQVERAIQDAGYRARKV